MKWVPATCEWFYSLFTWNANCRGSITSH